MATNITFDMTSIRQAHFALLQLIKNNRNRYQYSSQLHFNNKNFL